MASDTIYYGDHSKVTEDVLSYTDSDNDQSQSDNEYTYIYSKSDTESDSDRPEIPMEVQATVVQAILPFTGVYKQSYPSLVYQQSGMRYKTGWQSTIHLEIPFIKLLRSRMMVV